MKFTKIIALVMAAAMLVLSLASCSSAYKTPEKYVSVPTLKDVVLKQSAINDKLAETIKSIRESMKDQYFDEVTEGGAQKGDKLTLDYSAVLTNTELNAADFTILKGTDTAVIIGDTSSSINKSLPTAYSKDNKTAKGFEEQLIGAKKGDELTITCIFADSFGTTLLQGQEVTYTVKVDKVERVTVSKDHSLTVSFAPVDPDNATAMENIKDIIVTLEKTESNETQSDADTTTTAATTTTTTPTTTAPATGTTTPTKKFTDLFKSGSLSISFEEKDGKVKFKSETTKFSTIYDLGDLDPELFLGMNLYNKIAFALTVTADMVKANSSFKAYEGKDVYFTFELTKTTIVPEWTDDIVKKYTSEEYKTTKDYEVELTKSAVSTLAFEAIVDATTVTSYPDDELEEYYNEAVDSLVISALQEADPTFTRLSDYTQKEIDALISEKEYDAIWKQAIVTAKSNLKERLVIESLFNILNIKLSKAEYNERLNEEYTTNFYYYYYYYFGTSFTKSQLENMFGKEYFELQFKYADLLDLLTVDTITVENDVVEK